MEPGQTYHDKSFSKDNEASAPTSNLKQSMELAGNAYDRDKDAKSSHILSEIIVSESVGSASNLAESTSLPDTIPADKSGNHIF